MYKFYDEMLLRWLNELEIKRRIFEDRDIKYADLFVLMDTDVNILQKNLNTRDHRYETNPESIATDSQYLAALNYHHQKYFALLREQHKCVNLFNFTERSEEQQNKEIVYIIERIKDIVNNGETMQI